MTIAGSPETENTDRLSYPFLKLFVGSEHRVGAVYDVFGSQCVVDPAGSDGGHQGHGLMSLPDHPVQGKGTVLSPLYAMINFIVISSRCSELSGNKHIQRRMEMQGLQDGKPGAPGADGKGSRSPFAKIRRAPGLSCPGSRIPAGNGSGRREGLPQRQTPSGSALLLQLRPAERWKEREGLWRSCGFALTNPEE